VNEPLTRREWLARLSAAAVVPFVNGCMPTALVEWGREVHSEAAAQTGGGASPGDVLRTLAAVSERIIPADATPGAIEAGVPRFIERMLASWYEPLDQQRIHDGLAALDERAHAEFGLDFLSLGESQQDFLLLALDRLGSASWFATIKYLTIWGYYTSEVGITTELQDVVFAGRYEGCAPYTARSRDSKSEVAAARHEGNHHAAE
jgi:hypothetical protein